MGERNARQVAAELMRRFAARTGLGATEVPPRRYLWTDAFAVCNFLALDEGAGIDGMALAARLVDQVHHVLGRQRPDAACSGWLSGLPREEGEAHPTLGGLRIGKALPERRADEAPDEALEWERDGQYFHYLTRWMHALDQYARRSGCAQAQRWARELAQVAHRGFTYAPAPAVPKRMYWKMSIGLDRPLVASMGQHDPLDGLVTYLQLRAHMPAEAAGPDLALEVRDMAAIVAGTRLWTDDPLGIGGLLVDAHRLVQLLRERPADNPLLGLVLAAAASGLAAWLQRRPLSQPPAQRLAFRELGLAIGLHAVARSWRALEHDAGASADPALGASLDALIAQLPLARSIESFWRQPAHQALDGWLAHEDINAVMLATSLVPAGYLDFA